MSGGVDSSVAAAILKSKGFEVIGMTMCFGLSEQARRKPSCCGIRGIEDARRVADKLGIRHYAVNMHRHLEKFVISDFCHEYLSGRTPNPCVRCNQFLKFSILLDKARALGADFLATGHYARIAKSRAANRKPQTYLLKKARDKSKDQSYFLYRLTQKQLKQVLFPLGNYTKPQVRLLAGKFGLPVADKKASQEICFLGDDDYRNFLRKQMGRQIYPGEILDSAGKPLGCHKGIAYYTIGQRQGLGIAFGKPAYISRIDAANNRITIGPKEEVVSSDFLVREVNFVSEPIKKKIVLNVKIRYNHKEAPAEVSSARGVLKAHFKIPQFAITPGQSAVFYKSDRLIGGGIIEKVLNHD